MTYRTGNHWGVTVVDEQPDGAQLVAVVVNGDQALAERICALLNGAHTPDVDHAGSTAEGWAQAIATLRGVAARTGSPAATWAADYLRADPDRQGPREDDPCGPTSSTQTAEQRSVVGGHGQGDLSGSEGQPTHPGETWRWPTECNRCGEPTGPWSPDTIGSEMTHIVSGGGPNWEANRDHAPVFAELNRRADEHTEECR
jgi:hypothetical protein